MVRWSDGMRVGHGVVELEVHGPGDDTVRLRRVQVQPAQNGPELLGHGAVGGFGVVLEELGPEAAGGCQGQVRPIDFHTPMFYNLFNRSAKK